MREETIKVFGQEVDYAVNAVFGRRSNVYHAHTVILDDKKAYRLDLDSCRAAAAVALLAAAERVSAGAAKAEAEL